MLLLQDYEFKALKSFIKAFSFQKKKKKKEWQLKKIPLRRVRAALALRMSHLEVVS